jgi:hypothetical protein
MWCGKHPYGSAMGIGSGYPRYPADLSKGIPEGHRIVWEVHRKAEGGLQHSMAQTL